jgi:S1-C subfamily serine protease
MKRTAVFSGVLAVVVTAVVAGVAVRADDDAQTWTTLTERSDQDRGDRRGVVVAPGDRQVFRLDGRGSQLGVTVSDVEDGPAPGVRVDDVAQDSAASKGGVREGDIVVEFDGERVRSARQLTRLVQETPEGRTVKMTVVRAGQRQTLDVTPQATEFAWNREFGPELRAEIERSLPRLREFRGLPDMGAFNFRFDGYPGTRMRGRLGVQVETLGDQLAAYFGATDGGVLVSSVTADSPAAKAGLKAGDVITKVNGTAVKDAPDVIREIAELGDTTTVTLDIVRDKKATTLTATLEPPRPPRRQRSTRPA